MELFICVIVAAVIIGQGLAAFINFFLPQKSSRVTFDRKATIREGSLR